MEEYNQCGNNVGELAAMSSRNEQSGDAAVVLRELKALALKSWSRCSEAPTKARLLEAARAGDRLAVIETALQLMPSCELQQGSYDGKDEARAARLLERGELTEALAWAPASSELYARILARRLRQYYDSGELSRCSRDCRQLEQLGGDQRTKIEALIVRSNCSRAAGEAEAARDLLNEAMRRINALADSSEPSIKSSILRSCMPGAAPKNDAPSRLARRAGAAPGLLGGRPQGFLSRCSDAVAMASDRARGRFLYATRHIEPGSVLIVDRPYSFSTDLSALRNNCTNCHVSFRLDDVTQLPCRSCSTVRYCSEECSQSAWTRFHKYECRIFKYFYEQDLQKCNGLLAYRTVVAAALRVEADRLVIDEDFVRLHQHDRQVSHDVTKLMKTYEPDNYQTVFSLQSHGVEQSSSEEETFESALYAIFLANCLIYSLRQLGADLDYSTKLQTILSVSFLRNMQAIKCNAYEIVENVRDERTKILEPRNVGGAIYSSVSLTNHSCYPNVVRHCYPDGVVAVTSLRFIPKGAEILDCYGQHFLDKQRDHRRRHLKTKYYFECQCQACTFDWPTMLQDNDFRFKCQRCLKPLRILQRRDTAHCTDCGDKTTISKLYSLLQSSTDKRIAALTKMYDGFYADALALLVQHSSLIGKMLLEPSLEAVKTEQSIIQCLNAMSCVSV